MNNKLIFSLVLILFFACGTFSSSYAITTVPNAENVVVEAQEEDFEQEEFDIIKKISIHNKLKRSPKAQVENFYKKYNRYSSKNDIKKLKEMYSDSFINNDGFDKETIFKLMKEASDSYRNVSYDTEILNIEANDLYAVVTAKEIASGETNSKIPKIDSYGQVSSELIFKNYLKKEDGKWKIIAAELISEKIALKYGEAKNMNVTMFAPQMIAQGSDYEVSVKVDAPEGCFVVGSIVNEQIKFPQTNKKDVLRAVKSNELARMLKANTSGCNEYATISLGITRAHVEMPSVVIGMTGMAIVMSRVNVINKNNVIKKEN